MAPVEKSASKWQLMLSLDLDENKKAHQDLYGAMKREAVVVYDGLLKGRRQTLKSQYANVSEPWSYSQFTESALRQATERICARASSSTRPLYAKSTMDGNNWVVRWMLYHICRYRDNRNLRCRSSKFHEDDDKNMEHTDDGPSADLSSKVTGSGKGGAYYDAARNSYK